MKTVQTLLAFLALSALLVAGCSSHGSSQSDNSFVGQYAKGMSTIGHNRYWVIELNAYGAGVMYDTDEDSVRNIRYKIEGEEITIVYDGQVSKGTIDGKAINIHMAPNGVQNPNISLNYYKKRERISREEIKSQNTSMDRGPLTTS
jgi:hypothetical protein